MTRKQKKSSQGEKSSLLRLQNMSKVFLAVAKEPMSFSELLEETKLSKPVLASHLQYLEKMRSVYRDTIKPTQTSNAEEIGKIVYKADLDLVPEVLRTSLSLIDVLSGTLGSEKLDKKIKEHKEAIIKAILDYLQDHEITRDQQVKKEIEIQQEQLKKSLEEGKSS